MVKSNRKFFYTKSFRFVFLKFKNDQLGQDQQVVEGVGLVFCSLAKSHSLPVTLYVGVTADKSVGIFKPKERGGFVFCRM